METYSVLFYAKKVKNNPGSSVIYYGLSNAFKKIAKEINEIVIIKACYLQLILNCSIV